MKEDKPEIPKLTKNTSVPKWYESLRIVLTRILGVRLIPLIYVLRKYVHVPVQAPTLLTGKPYSADITSVVNELISRAGHDHPEYDEDNAQVLAIVDEAVRGTVYSSAISKARRAQDGRAAVATIIEQYAGKDKWEADRKRAEDTIRTSKWLGNTNYKLDSYIIRHRNAYNALVQCREHVHVEMPTEHRRVELLLDAIKGCNDATLRAASAAIEQNEDQAGPYYNFEKAASILQKADPVARKEVESKKKRPATQISEVNAQDNNKTKSVTISGAAAKAKLKDGVGSTGVEFRFYKKGEYAKLTDAQKEELREYNKIRKEKNSAQKAASGLITDKGKPTKSLTKIISQVIADTAKKNEEDESATLLTNLLTSVATAQATPSTTTQASSASASSMSSAHAAALQKTIQRILKNKK